MGRLRSIWKVLRGRRAFEQSMADELRDHLERYTGDLIASGLSRAEAERQARLEFGAFNTVEEECREARELHLFDELSRQFRYALRLLRKSPGFTAAALLTLTICLGANLSIFAVVDSVLLRPLPFPHSDRLVMIYNTYPKASVLRDGSSTENYYERRGRIPGVESLSIYREDNVVLGEPGSTIRAKMMRVSPEFFDTLGVKLARGVTFTEEQMETSATPTAILTDTAWRQSYNADPDILNHNVRIDGVRVRIGGVLPPGFRFLSSQAQVYLPFTSRVEERVPGERHSGGNYRHIIARLRPGVTVEQVQAQVDAQNQQMEAIDPKAAMMRDAGFRSVVVGLQADHVASLRLTLLWLQAGALALLLIGVVNLVNLFLIRANSRMKEIAVRQALGAGRRHVAFEVAMETTLLTIMGSLFGLLAAKAGVHLIRLLAADHLAAGATVMLDWRVAIVGFATALILGLLIALPITWFSVRVHLAGGMHVESRGSSTSRAAQRLRQSFVVAQIALALVLLSCAGLLGVSLKRILAVEPGFRGDHVIAGQLSLPWLHYSTWNARHAFYWKLLEQAQHEPGVRMAGLVTNVPLSGEGGKSAATVVGHVRQPSEAPRGHYSYGVGGDYFTAMGFQLQAGRFLTQDDAERSARVCVVDEDFAREYWPGSDALGHRLFQGSSAGKDNDAFTVVGVIRPVRQAGLTDETAQGAVYYPVSLWDDSRLFLVLRTSAEPERFSPALMKLVRSADPELPMSDIRTMEMRVDDSVTAYRSAVWLAGIFSTIALLLTAVGTYGVMSFAVEQQRREIGLRMALGARPGDVARQFLLLALKLFVAGAVLGVIGVWSTGWLMESLLFHIPAFYPAAVAGALGSILLVSTMACLLPSLRASRVSPLEVMTER